MMEFLAQVEPGLLYPALFVGLTLLGGFVLLPAMYMTLTGHLDLFMLFMLTLFAAATSDSVWYIIGLFSKKEKLYRLSFIKKPMEEAKRFSDFYSRHGVRLVFFTKFIYGTRLASHILAGMHKISYAGFLGATALGTAIWFWIFHFLIKALDFGVEATKSTAFRIQIIFLLGGAILVALNLLTGKYLRNRLMRSKRN